MRTKPHGRSLRTARERSRRSEGLIKIREDRHEGSFGGDKDWDPPSLDIAPRDPGTTPERKKRVRAG